ncbi:phage tail protein [Caballeronia sp. HLA56]
MGTILTITDAGRAALVAPNKDGTNAHKVVEIGLATARFEMSKALKSLPNEHKRLTTFGGANVAPDTIHATLTDDSEDQYTLFGFGLYLEDGTLLAVYGQDTPIMEKSPAAWLLLSADMQFAAIDATQLVFGETSFLNPPATADRAGVVRLATQTQVDTGRDTERVVTPATLSKQLRAKADLSGADFTGSIGTKDRLRLLAAPGGEAALASGNGDDCSSTTNNVALRSSHGIGFGPSVTNGPIAQEAFSHWFNTRTGDMGCRGALHVGGTITAQEPQVGDGPNTVPTMAWVLQTIAAAAIGSVWFEPRSFARAGFLKLDGATLKRTDYPALWAYAQASGALVKEIEWVVSRSGCFSEGDGALTFRLPDLRGEFIRAFDDGRGVDTNRVIGSFQAQDVQPHTHALQTSGHHYHAGRYVGEATENTNNGGNHTGLSDGRETRPRNIALLAMIRAY